jgi:two-component system, LuxR family, response regulator FixJ
MRLLIEAGSKLRRRNFPGAEALTHANARRLKRCGASNKEAGRALGISPRTIEVHRSPA